MNRKDITKSVAAYELGMNHGMNFFPPDVPNVKELTESPLYKPSYDSGLAAGKQLFEKNQIEADKNRSTGVYTPVTQNTPVAQGGKTRKQSKKNNKKTRSHRKMRR